MRWIVRGSGGDRQVDVQPTAEGFEVVVDGGRRQRVDLICLDSTLASMRDVESNRSFRVSFQRGRDHDWRVAVGEREFELVVLTPVEAAGDEQASSSQGALHLEAPIPGKVVAVKVAPGDQVVEGQPLVVLEAMKMENELLAGRAGVVSRVHVAAGATVDRGALLVELE